MPHLNGVVTAGIAEATRVAHNVIHRGAETATAVVVGQKVDQAHADRIPDTQQGAHVSDQPHRERERRQGDGTRDGREHEETHINEPGMGSRIDLMA